MTRNNAHKDAFVFLPSGNLGDGLSDSLSGLHVDGFFLLYERVCGSDWSGDERVFDGLAKRERESSILARLKADDERRPFVA
jgi:hypothetical protein